MALACSSSLELVEENRELVAAEPGERVALPQARLEAARHRREQLVADQVAETVVDDLEAVEIEIERREPAAGRAGALNSSRRRPEPFHEDRAVAQPGQRIGEPGAAERLRPRPPAPSVSRSAIRRCGPGAGRRLAPRRRGTGTAGRCRPRGGSGARAESDPSCRRDARRAPALSGAMSSAWTRSIHSSGRPMPAGAGRPIIALHRPETVELLAAKIPFPQPVVRAFRREREPLFASLERVFRARSLGDVVPEQRHAAGHRKDLDLQNPRARGGRQPELRQRPGAPVRQRLVDRSRQLGLGQGRHRAGERTAQRPLAGTAQDPFEDVVPERDPAVAVDDGHALIEGRR